MKVNYLEKKLNSIKFALILQQSINKSYFFHHKHSHLKIK